MQEALGRVILITFDMIELALRELQKGANDATIAHDVIPRPL
jgi:hypothetical protein